MPKPAEGHCCRCPQPASRTLGTDPYCEQCLEDFLGPIRETVNARDAFTGIGYQQGPRPDYGPGWYDLKCSTCGAGWVGKRGEPCDWCAAALERLIEDQRQLLLWPDWLAPDHGPRYDELDDIGKRLWDQTRGQTLGTGSKDAWLDRLVIGIKAGLITEAEAKAACERYDREYADGDV